MMGFVNEQRMRSPCLSEESYCFSSSSSVSESNVDGIVPPVQVVSSSWYATSSLSSSAESVDDDEDIDSRIDFIQEQQRILKHAFDEIRNEENYDASIALHKVSNTGKHLESPLWAFAKQVLLDDTEFASSSSSSSSTQSRDECSYSFPPTSAKTADNVKSNSSSSGRFVKPLINPRNPLINISSVRHCHTMPGMSAITGRSTNEVMTSFPTLSPFKEHWMSKALVMTGQTTTTRKDRDVSETLSDIYCAKDNDSEWRTTFDSQANMSGLIPPSQYCQDKNITLQEAITSSSEPRLITQSVPPFGIIFANTAFLKLTGLTSQESLIGKPIEDVFQIKPSGNGTTTVEPHSLNIAMVMNGCKRFNITVSGIQDRSKRQKVMQPAAGKNECITQILVVFKAGDNNDCTEAPLTETPVSMDVFTKKYESPVANIHFGAIG